MASLGKVYLIGAGPGAPDLLTVRAVVRLRHADLVLIDDLVDADVLRHCASSARVVRVGKRAGCRSTPQPFIERLMLRYARQGKRVARLKGGDSFVFGRGGEECQYLLRHGIDVEMVPGVTAGIAVPELLGIPVTHRGVAHAVTFVTGHVSAGAEPDWAALGRLDSTLVIYMGARRIGHIAASLLAAGMRPDTPAAVISQGSLPGERHVIARLDGITQASSEARLGTPAVIVIGEVVSLARPAELTCEPAESALCFP